MRVSSRFKVLARSAFVGWIAGGTVMLPFQIAEAMRNAGLEARNRMELMLLSIALYAVLSFAVSFYSCVMFFFPMAWLFASERIIARRRLWVVLSTLFGFALMGLRAHIWTAFRHDGVGMANFWFWALFAALFFGVTAADYVRKLVRTLKRTADAFLPVAGSWAG
jgi:hypothetical protein